MQRREFLRTTAAAVSLPLLPKLLRAGGVPADLKITRVIGFEMPGRRPKLVGKNSRLGEHGETTNDPMVRIYTNAGIDGFGWSRAGREECARLLGRNPMEFFVREERRTKSPVERGTSPLWDLIGKVLGEPIWRLLGGRGPERVPVYDGSVYFLDLLPQYASKWRDRVREEIDMGRERGHTVFKAKVGRGAKWMPRAEGDARDVEVVKQIAAHGGRDVGIGVDANNGYDLAGAKEFLRRAEGVELLFVEEMFEEQVEQCLEYKRFIADQGRKTLLADGETVGELDALRPFIEAGAIEVLQGDMNRFGIEGILEEASLAEPKGLQVAPHNWGSIFGFYAQLQGGRGIGNFYRAEQDPSVSDLLIAEGFRIENGACRVPDTPGFGLKLDEGKFERAKVRFDLSV